MKIRVDTSALRESTWRGHLLRFAIGGAATVATGLLAKAVGPVVGGLFLAFPATFPLSAATIEKLENEKVGPLARGDRARRAALTDAAGAAMGSVGMLAFATTIWRAPPVTSELLAFMSAVLAWSVVAFATWTLRRRWMNSAFRSRPR